MANYKVNIGLIGNQDKNFDTLSSFIQDQLHQFDLSIDFFNSDISLKPTLAKSEYDVFFLDADTPDLDLQAIKRIKQDSIPLLVLISSSETKALEAFEINALDFLLKPLQRERIRKCLEKIREEVEASKVVKKLQQIDKIELPFDNGKGRQYLSRILIRNGKKMFFVNVDSIVWVESEGNYNRIYTKNDDYLNRGSLKHLIKKLDPSRFIRIHRSTIVNVDMVKEIEPFFHGDYKVIMKDYTELKLSRTYSDFLSEFKCTI